MPSKSFLEDAVGSFPRSRTVIIFDYDSTVARVPVDWVATRGEYRTYLNYHFTGLAVKPGLRLDEMENLALLAYPDKHELIFAYREGIESSTFGKHEPVHDTVNFVERESRRTLYILSNNLHSTIVAGLKQLNLVNRFVEVVGVDDAGAPKPSITALKLFLKLDPHIVKKAIFIGDSNGTDGKFCDRVGIPFINIMSREIRINDSRYD